MFKGNLECRVSDCMAGVLCTSVVEEMHFDAGDDMVELRTEGFYARVFPAAFREKFLRRW
jgi:hypothetical protein